MTHSLYQDKIDDCFAGYEALQERHLALLKDPTISDISEITAERKAASASLQRALDEFMGQAGSLGKEKSIEMLTDIKTRLDQILKLDEVIAIEVEKHRDQLKTNLNRLKKGKAAMQGYRPAGAVKGGPRVFSISR